MEPADASQHYSERLITLPGLGTRYSSPPVPAAVSRRQLGLPEQRTLYLLPQALFKLHPDNDSILVDIVRHDPGALFVLFELRAPSPIRRIRERLLHALARVSEQPQQNLHWFAECAREDYLRINRACDVMVDSLHWSGGNASLDALHCGLPVITCPGRYMRGRQSAAMLRALDCAELIAQSPRNWRRSRCPSPTIRNAVPDLPHAYARTFPRSPNRMRRCKLWILHCARYWRTPAVHCLQRSVLFSEQFLVRDVEIALRTLVAASVDVAAQ